MAIRAHIRVARVFLDTVAIFIAPKDRWAWRKVLLWPFAGLTVLGVVLGIYGVGVGAAAVIVARDPGYLGSVGFLVVGALLGIYLAFLIEEFKRHRAAKNLTKALFHELANRVGRCCFDFEAPWHSFLEVHEDIEVSRLRKFAPDPPIIYPAVASQIALLKDDAAQAIIDFYIALAAWARAIETRCGGISAKG